VHLQVLGKKLAAAIAAGLNVIFCIGEMLEDRESGKTNDVCFAQLKAAAGAQVSRT
jgi:triosephosphate isomerase